MRALFSLEKSFLPICILALFLRPATQGRAAQSLATRQSANSANASVHDAEQRAGPFAIGGQSYTVVLHWKSLAGASDHTSAQTLSCVQILDAAGSVSYQKDFPFRIEQGRFLSNPSASVEQVSGNTGTGLVIHYRDEQPASLSSAPQIQESWQLFGLVNDKLTPLGKPALIGEPGAGGPYMGVMMKAANGKVTVVDQPDTIELRAWTGYFYVFIPLRVNWNRGGLAQGQRCMEMFGGGLTEVGCPMRVNAVRKPPTNEFTFARLFVEAHENPDAAEHVVIQKDSKVEILGSSAITNWNISDDRIAPIFSDIWLHVRIDAHTGWIHGADDFAAVGLPAGSPAP